MIQVEKTIPLYSKQPLMTKHIQEILLESIAIKEKIYRDQLLVATIEEITKVCTKAFQQDKKVFFCGNGGSAADAQHLAAEFSGRFYLDRQPLFAEALHVNTSFLTAVANDYSFAAVYARLIEAKGRQGDVLFGISTSGQSENIVKALQQAKKQGMITVGFTGQTGGELKKWADHLVNIPSMDTPRIQEAHILVGHIICQIVEHNLYG